MLPIKPIYFVSELTSDKIKFLDKEKTMGAQVSKSLTYSYTAETDGFLSGSTNGNTASGTVVADGVSHTALSVGSNSQTQIMVPISKGKVYTFTQNVATFTDLYFTPLD